MPERRPVVKAADWLLFGLVILTAIILGALHLCPFDWMWAAATVGVVVFWTWMLSRKRSKSAVGSAPSARPHRRP